MSQDAVSREAAGLYNVYVQLFIDILKSDEENIEDDSVNPTARALAERLAFDSGDE